MNTSNVALKTRVMPEWRRIFEAKDFEFGRRGLVAMEVYSSTEMGAPSSEWFAGNSYVGRDAVSAPLLQRECVDPRADNHHILLTPDHISDRIRVRFHIELRFP